MPVTLAIYINLIFTSVRKDIGVNLGERVVSQLTEKLQQTLCAGYFHNFFNSPVLI